MGSLGLFLQCAVSLLFSLVMDRLVQRFGTRAVYLASVVAFPVAAGTMCLSRSVAVVTASAALTGFTFSALQILPYTLASLYHREKQVLTLAAGWGGGGGQPEEPGQCPAGELESEEKSFFDWRGSRVALGQRRGLHGRRV